jgi:hypothetical protein
LSGAKIRVFCVECQMMSRYFLKQSYPGFAGRFFLAKKALS